LYLLRRRQYERRPLLEGALEEDVQLGDLAVLFRELLP
jgi:hypothetical protein